MVMKRTADADFIPEAKRMAPDARLERLRSLAWLLDRSIPIGGGRRIGLDPILGLLPGVGDWAGALLSLFLLYEAARMGMSMKVLSRIAGNILIESIVGTIPIAGDLFDFAWQANMRNMKIIEANFHRELRPRSLASIWVALGLFTIALLLLIGLAIYGLVKLLSQYLPSW
jgi:hypothetical protein